MSDNRQFPAGLVGEATIVVSPEVTARHLGSGTVAVFATPEMVRLMERAAVNGLAPYLAPGQQSVGTMVNVKHLAATPLGATVTARAELLSVDGRRLPLQGVGARWDRPDRRGDARARADRPGEVRAAGRGEAEGLDRAEAAGYGPSTATFDALQVYTSPPEYTSAKSCGPRGTLNARTRMAVTAEPPAAAMTSRSTLFTRSGVPPGCPLRLLP